MTYNYKQAKSEIFWNRVKGGASWVAAVFQKGGSLILYGVGIALLGLSAAADEGSNRTWEYSKKKFEEARETTHEAQENKKQDNKKFEDELKKQEESDVSESDVESDLEEESFVELTV